MNIETSEPGRVFIYAMDGRLVLEQEVLRGTNKIVLSNHNVHSGHGAYPKGVYLVRVVGEKGFAVRKVLVE